MRRQHLQDLITYFKTRAAAAGLALMPSDTAIQPMMVGEEQWALDISAQLEQRGILVTAIRPPTVPVGSSRLRITLSAAHSRGDIDTLIEALIEIVTPGAKV